MAAWQGGQSIGIKRFALGAEAARSFNMLLPPCVRMLHFIFIEQDRPRPRTPCPKHAF